MAPNGHLVAGLQRLRLPAFAEKHGGIGGFANPADNVSFVVLRVEIDQHMRVDEGDFRNRRFQLGNRLVVVRRASVMSENRARNEESLASNTAIAVNLTFNGLFSGSFTLHLPLEASDPHSSIQGTYSNPLPLESFGPNYSKRTSFLRLFGVRR